MYHVPAIRQLTFPTPPPPPSHETTTFTHLLAFDISSVPHHVKKRCLWKPEMYELLYLSGRAGAPFSQSPNYETDGTIFTCKNEPVRLLGQVRDVMRELYCHEKWTGTNVGISSRTDQPDWARKLLQKFTITTTQLQQQQQQQQQEEEEEVATAAAAAATSFCIRDVIQGPIEISSASKVKHFERISAQTGVAMEDILFFDNERGNCREVANLGVVVGYCPDGVTKTLWDLALKAFPIASGKVVGLDIYRYDTLEGANSFYDVDVP